MTSLGLLDQRPINKDNRIVDANEELDKYNGENEPEDYVFNVLLVLLSIVPMGILIILFYFT